LKDHRFTPAALAGARFTIVVTNQRTAFRWIIETRCTISLGPDRKLNREIKYPASRVGEAGFEKDV
jgi:hypothetical protein